MRFLRPLLLATAAALPAGIVLWPSAARAQEPLQPDPPAQVWVHLDGARDASLERQNDDGSWCVVCAGACDRQLPLEARYRIAGDNVRSSEPFVLAGAAPGDHVALKVRAGNAAAHDLGIAAVPLGIVVGLVGGAMIWVGGLGSRSPDRGPVQNDAQSSGLAAVAAGVLLTGIGIVAIATNGTTDVSVQRAPTIREEARATTPWRPTPTWRAPSPEERAMPSTVGASLWTMRF